jgi:amidase
VTDDLPFRPARELARLIRDRELSPVELVETCLDRIDRLDPQLGSVVVLDERAVETARSAEAAVGGGGPHPPFLGVPTLIKDLHLTTGLRTTFSHRGMAEFVPPFDEEAVARLRRAGFVILGKSNAPEFGSMGVTEPLLHGPTRNPWDTDRTAGGSSGGAAAAVAAGLVPVAHASDGAGSIRIPAACCGVFGMKPARGRVSQGPLFGDMGLGLSTQGPITRDVGDAAAMLDVMAGYAIGDPSWAPEPARPFAEEVGQDPGVLRIGLVTAWAMGEIPAEAAATAEAAAELLAGLGHVVEPCALPLDTAARDHFLVVWGALQAALPVDRSLLEPFNAGLVRVGEEASAGRLMQAINALQLLGRQAVAATAAYDVLLAPTLAQRPVPIGTFDGRDVDETLDGMIAFVGMTAMANVTGQPSMSVPTGVAADGLPTAIMLTGRPADEATLFRLAGQLEAAAPWAHLRPPVS